MSSDAAVARPTFAAALDAGTIRHALRIAGGIAVPFLLGEALGRPLPYLASILALQLLAVRRPAPSLAAGIASVLGIAVAFFAALVLARITLTSVTLFVLASGLAVFGGLYAQRRYPSPFWFLLLIAITAIPLMAVTSPTLAATLAGAMVEAMAAALLAVWLMHAVFPETGPAGSAASAPVQPLPSPLAADHARGALAGTLIVMPLVVFLLGNESAAIVMVVTTLSILSAAGFARGVKAAGGVLLGNLLAGLLAVLAYRIIDIAPSLPLLCAVVLALALFFGERIATAGPTAPVFVLACTAALVLLGSGLSPFTDTATAFATRVAHVMLASAYTVGLLALFIRGKS